PDGYVQRASDGSFALGGAYGLFALPGEVAAQYQKAHTTTLQLTGRTEVTLGAHQVEFGGEYEQQNRRFFNITAGQLARFYNDGHAESSAAGIPEGGVTRYDQLSFEAMRAAGGSSYTYYGYDFLGFNEVNDQDVDAVGEGTNCNVAPYQPIYYAGYVQDKIEYRDLVINLGLRVDVFDNNALVLRDPFSPYPILRAGDLDNYGEFSPFGIGQDYAAYFANPNDPSTVVGFRDLDGNFYDLQGNATTQELLDAAGRVRVTSTQVNADMFTEYEPEVTVMPRVGVSFPVTDRALFFASYNVTSQRPSEAAFTPSSVYDNLSIGTTYSNANLKPEQTTQYELGLRQRLGERAAVTVS